MQLDSSPGYLIRPSPKVIKYLKHIKDRRFKSKVVNIIYKKIAKNPYKAWPEGHGLPGIRCWKFTYSGTYYRIAYNIRNHHIILIIMAGSHENFYARLKQYLDNSSWLK